MTTRDEAVVAFLRKSLEGLENFHDELTWAKARLFYAAANTLVSGNPNRLDDVRETFRLAIILAGGLQIVLEEEASNE